MNARLVTKFVVLCLSTALVACQDGPKKDATMAPGLSSKTGQSIVSQNWCTEAKVQADNAPLSVDRFSFRTSGDVVITRLNLQKNNQLEPGVEDTGTWSLLNDQLILMHGTTTMQYQVEFSQRATDQAQCLNITANGVTQNLCTCQL